MGEPTKIEVSDELWWHLRDEVEMEATVVAQFPDEEEPCGEFPAKVRPAIDRGYAWLEVEAADPATERER